ncbi:MAG: ankyrin repeat domain-containing protein [Verrucomicrobiota bacterium]
MTERKSWLKRRYGFDTIPSNMGLKKLNKIFLNALSKRKVSVLKTIIRAFPDFHHDKSMSITSEIVCHFPEFLETAFELGLHPDSGRQSFLCLVYSDPEAIRLGLKYGANIEGRNEDGEVALGYACAWGHFDSVKLLLESGANINVMEGKEHLSTPLDAASNNKEIYDYMRCKGAKHYKEIREEEG